MLVAIFSGSDREAPKSKGNHYFGRSPKLGDQVEVEGELFVVTKAWHTPDTHFAGPKFSILLQDEISRGTSLPLAAAGRGQHCLPGS
jgi:hypothetical protein